MTATRPSSSAAVRARLRHPVIDSDGHIIEFVPAVMDSLKQIAGPTLAARYRTEWNGEQGGSWGLLYNWERLTPAERQDRRATCAPWWAVPAKNTLDRATATLPKLLYERLDEIGLDFTVLYPSMGLLPPHLEDAELRQAVCRAFNTFYADSFRDYADRMTAVALIPMHTPEEAIAELEYAVNGLGLKAVLMAGHVRRPIPAAARVAPELARYACWLDFYGLDSQYDYDPVWAKCIELKVPPTFHSPAMGWGSRTSISNYMYNHIGHFAAAGEALCKSLFMGGVTRRFPSLKFAFLEGGVYWACSLYADLIGHWEKRNRESVENYSPVNMDRELFVDLCRRYGGKMVEGKLDWVRREAPNADTPVGRDDWERCGIEKAEDIRALFVPNFYFGCEADDPLNAVAFNPTVNPFGARLQAIFSSDLGHWDVPDMTEVVAEAYELVEKDLLTEEDFRKFVFEHPASLWTSMNPDFFRGTAVEKYLGKGEKAKREKGEREV